MNKLNQYRNYLKILGIFHYVIGGMYGFITLTGILSFFVMNEIIQNTEIFPEQLEQQEQAMQLINPLMIAHGIGGIILALGIMFSGWMIQKRKYYWFSLVIAAIMMFAFQYIGTILGIFTIIVLAQETTKKLYFSDENLLIEEIQKEEEERQENLNQDLNQGINAESDTDITGGVIPYKNPKALISYYLGIFSIIPFIGAILGTIAIVLGIQGLKDYNINPNVRGRVHSSIGIGCGSIFTLLWLILLLVFIILK